MSFSGMSSGSGSIQGSTDVFLSSPSTGQVLSYDAGTLKWVNSTASVTAASVTAALADISQVNLVEWSGSAWPPRPDVPWPITYTGPIAQKTTMTDMRVGDMWSEA